MSEQTTHRRQMIGLDVANPVWRRALVEAVRYGSQKDGKFKPISRARAAAAADEVLALLSGHAEDLEPLMDRLSAGARDAELESQRSAARVAVTEERAGIGPEMIRGEVVASDDERAP